MENKIVIFALLFFFLYDVNPQQKKSIKPTSKGIDKEVNDSSLNYLRQFERFVKDTIQFDIYISSEDLSKTTGYDSTELGRFYIPDQIVINNEEKYVAYRLGDLPKSRRKQYEKNNAFVKGVILHEIAHVYFTQTILLMRMYNMEINPAYNNFRLIPTTESNFGSNFIEEGVCEYCVQKMNESIVPDDFYVPKTIEEVSNPKNMYLIKYEYASFYVRDFLDAVGVKQGIRMMVRNKPPSYEEILNPNLYFSRITQ